MLGNKIKIVRDITVIFGPPGPREMQQQLEEWGEKRDLPRDRFWLEFVHNLLRTLATRAAPNAQSQFEVIFSDILGMSVRVDEPYMTYLVQDDKYYPAVTLVPSNITSLEGAPVSVDFSDGNFTDALRCSFGYLLKTEWVRTDITYE